MFTPSNISFKYAANPFATSDELEGNGFRWSNWNLSNSLL